jgi:hypothetical protein
VRYLGRKKGIMPASQELPQDLRDQLEDMEAAVQDFKSTLAFAAPETYDFHYINLQNRLADIIMGTYFYKDGKQVD